MCTARVIGSGLRLTGAADPLGCADPLADPLAGADPEAGAPEEADASAADDAGAGALVLEAAAGEAGADDDGPALPGVVVAGTAFDPLPEVQPASSAVVARRAAGVMRTRRAVGREAGRKD